MENKPKSLLNFISQKVDEFTYEDFQPPVDRAVLKGKLQEKFGFDSPFWMTSELPRNWQERWFSIELRSVKDWMPLYVGFSITSHKINMVVYEEIAGSSFSDPHYESEMICMKFG